MPPARRGTRREGDAATIHRVRGDGAAKRFVGRGTASPPPRGHHRGFDVGRAVVGPSIVPWLRRSGCRDGTAGVVPLRTDAAGGRSASAAPMIGWRSGCLRRTARSAAAATTTARSRKCSPRCGTLAPRNSWSSVGPRVRGGDSAQSDGGDPGVGGPDGWAARRGGAGACGGGMVRRWSQHHAAPRGSCAWSPSAANHARLAGNASPDARKWGPPGAFPAAARDADSRRKGRDSGRVAASAGRDRKSAFALVRKRDRDGGNRQRRAEVDRTRHLGREATRQDG